MSIFDTEELARKVLFKPHLWLFLDYDGTLADFEPTPETIHPDPRLAHLLRRLASEPRVRVAIISGRRLTDVQKLVPVSGLFLAGTYGMELLTSSGKIINRVQIDDLRPYLDEVKPDWIQLITGKTGFYIEDKGMSLALHARFSSDEEAEQVLSLARETVDRILPGELFRILGGHKFLEAAPLLAHKGKTVSYLLEAFPWPEAQLVYIGDDDKDEEAFEVVKTHAGIAIKVIEETSSQLTKADYVLTSPAAVRSWLENLETLLLGGEIPN